MRREAQTRSAALSEIVFAHSSTSSSRDDHRASLLHFLTTQDALPLLPPSPPPLRNDALRV